MRIIGITSQIGMGKTSAAGLLGTLLPNAQIFDADKAVEYLYKNNTELVEEIASLDASAVSFGRVSKSKLKKLLIEKTINFNELNEIVHPYVQEYMEQKIKIAKQNNIEYFILDVPLLLNSKTKDLCNIIICIYTDRNEQIRRLKLRDVGRSDEEIEMIIANQMPIEEQVELSDYVINNTSREEFFKNVKDVANKIINEKD